MAIIKFKAVEFSYTEKKPVLKGVNMEMERKKISVLMGPSGAGKTTVLRLINKLESPTRGEIRRNFNLSENNKNLHHTLRLRRNMGFVFQEPSLFGGSVRMNVAYGKIVRMGVLNYYWKKIKHFRPFVNGVSKVDEEVSKSLEMVGLNGFQERSVRSLSAGEQRRVTLARSLITEPELLLLDEPTSNLDPRNTSIIEDLLADVRNAGTSIIMATHDMHQAERMADEVFLLLGGSIVEGGPTGKIFNSPEDERTAGFIDGRLVV